MDPDVTLAKLREALARMGAASEGWEYENAAAEVAEHFQNLDRWLSIGRSLPEDWRRGE